MREPCTTTGKTYKSTSSRPSQIAQYKSKRCRYKNDVLLHKFFNFSHPINTFQNLPHSLILSPFPLFLSCTCGCATSKGLSTKRTTYFALLNCFSCCKRPTEREKKNQHRNNRTGHNSLLTLKRKFLFRDKKRFERERHQREEGGPRLFCFFTTAGAVR